MNRNRAKKNHKYWADREKENRKKVDARTDGYEAEINEIYANMESEIDTQIQAWYQKYATDEGISMAEARKRVSKLDIEAYERKAKRYVKQHNFSDQANAEMKLYNLTMKVNRLEMLKAQIGLEMTAANSDVENLMKQHLQDESVEEYSRLAGILGGTITGDLPERAASIAEGSYKGATFSERIWTNQDALKAQLDITLRRAIIGGRGADALTSDLTNRFDVSRNEAKRLLVTEIRRVQTDTARRLYEDQGFARYTFMATGPRPCEVCKALDNKNFLVKDMLPGENAPPMHPYCHCTTAPYVDEQAYNEWLDSYSEHKTNFKDWKSENGYD